MPNIKTDKNEIPPLLNSPLVEAIFEVRWELQGDQQTGRYRDPSYPMMYGRLYERMKKDFPLIEDLPSNQVHPEANPYVVRHRLRKEKDGYPLIQIGPGIATVNEAKGYSWRSLRSVILRLVESIADLYPVGTLPLNFIKCELRYLNAIRFDAQKENPLTFLGEKLHTKIEMNPELYATNEMSSQPNALSFHIAHALHRPVGNLILSASLGQIEGKSAYLVQSVVDSMGETVPHDRETFETWLENSHEVAEKSFLSFCKGPLLEQFCGGV